MLRGIYPDGLPQEKWAGLTVRYLDDYTVPEVAELATAEEVNAALDGVELADAESVKAAIGGDAAKYAEFRHWASQLSEGEIAAVLSTNAAVSYLLGAERLFVNTPKVEFTRIKAGNGMSGAEDYGRITVTVAVKDGEDIVRCAADKVKNMFEASSSLNDWDGASKLIPTVTVEQSMDGQNSMRFIVTPGDGTAKKAFLRVKVR